MKETMMPANTAEHFQTTRTVEVRDVTASVTETGIERNLKLIRVKNTELRRNDTGMPRAY